MAIQLEAGEYGRGDVFFIDPKEIIVNDNLNGRYMPHEKDAVEKRCRSFEEVGQLQPVIIRKVTDDQGTKNRVQLVAGYCRHAAALLYNEKHPDKPMQLKCVVGTMNAEEAFVKNLVENMEREDTTPVDDAYNQRRLREEHAWTDKRIAEFYKKGGTYVQQLKKLLTLPTQTIAMVHGRMMALSAAVALTDLSEEDQKEFTQAAQKSEEETETPPVDFGSNGQGAPKPKDAKKPKKVTAAEIKKKVREKKVAKGEKQARSLKEVREYFEWSAKSEIKGVKKLSELMLKFVNGAILESEMTKRMNALMQEVVAV